MIPMPTRSFQGELRVGYSLPDRGKGCPRHAVQLRAPSVAPVRQRTGAGGSIQQRSRPTSASIDQAEGAAGSSLSPPNPVVKPSKSATVTVSAEWPLLRNGDGTLSAK